jgi:hypothetical protein
MELQGRRYRKSEGALCPGQPQRETNTDLAARSPLVNAVLVCKTRSCTTIADVDPMSCLLNAVLVCKTRSCTTIADVDPMSYVLIVKFVVLHSSKVTDDDLHCYNIQT